MFKVLPFIDWGRLTLFFGSPTLKYDYEVTFLASLSTFNSFVVSQMSKWLSHGFQTYLDERKRYDVGIQ